MASAELQRVLPERIYTLLSDTLFYGFYLVAKDVSMSSALFTVSVVVQFVQMLYFPVALLLNAGEFGAVLATVLRLASLTRADENFGPDGMLALSMVVRAALCARRAAGHGAVCAARVAFRSATTPPRKVARPPPHLRTEQHALAAPHR